MRCDSTACVGILVSPEDVYIWDTKDPRVQLRFTGEEWETFIDDVKAGKHDLQPPVIDAEEVSQEPAEQLTIDV